MKITRFAREVNGQMPNCLSNKAIVRSLGFAACLQELPERPKGVLTPLIPLTSELAKVQYIKRHGLDPFAKAQPQLKQPIKEIDSC